jgi:hypothetical protein
MILLHKRGKLILFLSRIDKFLFFYQNSKDTVSLLYLDKMDAIISKKKRNLNFTDNSQLKRTRIEKKNARRYLRWLQDIYRENNREFISKSILNNEDIPFTRKGAICGLVKPLKLTAPRSFLGMMNFVDFEKPSIFTWYENINAYYSVDTGYILHSTYIDVQKQVLV